MTECEDPTKRFYDEDETYNFRGIESQFPMVFSTNFVFDYSLKFSFLHVFRLPVFFLSQNQRC